MESWRERGFVPDSDDEDGFDSQDRRGIASDINGDGEDAVAAGSENGGLETEVQAVRGDDTDLELLAGDQDAAASDHDEQELPLPEGLSCTPEDRGEDGPGLGNPVGKEVGVHDVDSASVRDEDNVSLTEERSQMLENEDEPDLEKIADREGDSARREETPEAQVHVQSPQNPPSTGDPRPKSKRDFWDIPSSSPDLLQLDHHPWRKQASHSPSPASTPTPKAKADSQPRPQIDDVDSSPLSSPPSSLRALLDEDHRQGPEEPQHQDLDDLLSHLDIPREILQGLDASTRRSLRQRNPIQLHPYLLEDAKYQKLMKARGVKPVRIAQSHQRAAPTADESQGQDFGDEAGSNSESQLSDTRFLPSSPIHSRQPLGLTSEPVEDSRRQSLPHPTSPMNGAGSRSPKRRRVAGPDDGRQWQNLRPVCPQVVIHNVSSSSTPNAPSIFDIPSPPRSGSVSSPPMQTKPRFRFPRKFPPPIFGPETETRQSAKDISDTTPNLDELIRGTGQISDDASSVQSASHGNITSDSEEESTHLNGANLDEVAVRRLQRRIKGVLPASWLRLDQQKQKDLQSATQRNHDRLSRIETEAAKGVARKVTKKANPSVPSGPMDQLSSLRQLADESDTESERDADNADRVEPRQDLADLVGFSDVQRADDDLMEDNRIDYMFPTISRNHTPSHGRKPSKKRKPDTDERRRDGRLKKPRLKRQARLTDPVYGSRKMKRPAQRLPKLGVLDAPDAARSTAEQPQFLRVAARKARSRQDRGRQSPSRKVIKLSTRLDTDDANISLRDWRAGRMQQTTLPALPKKPRQKPRRRPLEDLSTNTRSVPKKPTSKGTGQYTRNDTRPAVPTTNNPTIGENDPVPSTSPDTRPEDHNTAPSRPVQQLRGNAWIVQRNLAISSLSRSNPRPVVPEVGNLTRQDITNTNSSLQKSLAQLNRDPDLPLNRFLSGDAVPSHSPIEPNKTNNELPKPNAGLRRRQLKKRAPKRIVVDDTEDHAPFVSFSPEAETPEPQNREYVPHARNIGGLNNFKTPSSIDFGISPLPSGTFFHESTFIGSGAFSRSLNITKRDLDRSTGVFSIEVGDRSMRWGAWDDSVSSQFGVAFNDILKTTEHDRIDRNLEGTYPVIAGSASATYENLIKYVTEGLTFFDPIDRMDFVTKANGLVSKLMEDLSAMFSSNWHGMRQLARIASLNVVFANQVCQIACHSIVSQSVRDTARDLAKSASRQVITFASNPTGQAEIQKLLTDSKLREQREAGIKTGYPTVDAYVIVQHVLSSADRFKGCLEDIVAEVYFKCAQSSKKDISGLEDGWQRVFTALPLQEIDVRGIAHLGSRFNGSHDNWAVVKLLLRPVFDSEGEISESQPVSYYKYCRILFQRCFILINSWGWRDCKPILDTLYDFFAKRTCYNLKSEESFRSPSFLDELDGNPSFDVRPDDPCFHILLKIIASGLRFLSKAYNEKTIRNYAYRLLPNHGKVYPKEQPIRQADLDALRNHHDLLCTVYSSVPDGCRPRPVTIKNLVHPANSHHETCNISLRSWARLARFKLSRNEDVSGLEPFAEWHGYFVTEFLKQHSLARREVEAQAEGGKQFSQEVIDRTITQNQRQIESLLKTALQGLQNAIQSARDVEHAQEIVSQTPIASVLGLFNAKVYRLNSTVSEALGVIMIYLQKCTETESSPKRVGNVPIEVDEDSQEYQGWADIEAVYGIEFPRVEYVEKVFHPAVSRLVSNCFGEDHYPDDVILLNVVDCWTSVARALVSHGLRSWDGYIDPYGSDSWMALRATTQTRKYTPQFLAMCIEKDDQFLSDHKVTVLKMWMSSLVERASMMKFQHHLTEALMNSATSEPVLKNLPFSRDAKEGRFLITYTDLSHRQKSLLSSILSNMRAHIQNLEDAKSPGLETTQREYRDILQQMMISMKSNYQDMGGNAGIQCAYADFVQCIVGFLQQYTRDICPIHSFFTSAASFHLPSKDPTYIVSKLKSYEPRPSSAKVASLSTFVQGVSERAALDGKQKYLTNQLYDSMVEGYEAGNLDQPTLRATLLQYVFPEYLATAFFHPAAWILSRPIIETTSRVFKDFLFKINTTDSGCVKTVLGIFKAVFESSHKALHLITNSPNMLKEPTVLITVAAFLEMITSSLPTLDYLDRLATDLSIEPLIAQIRTFQHFALFVLSHLHQTPPDIIDTGSPTPSGEPESDTSLCGNATRKLQSYIAENWSVHQGKYFTKRGGLYPQEIKIDESTATKLANHPESGLVCAADGFLEAIDDLDLLGEGINGADEVVRLQEAESDLIWEGLGEDFVFF
ncbi:Mus7/MMS22 family-domain-containing protein [Aspergillus californicus]